MVLGNSIAKLVQKNSEIRKENFNLEQQVERYKNQVQDLDTKIHNLEGQVEMMQQQQNLRVEQQTPSTSQPDKKPSLDILQQSQQPNRKPDLEKLQPSEQPPALHPPSKLSQPNFLEKYEFKKLNHFERMQQERGHQTKNLIEPEVSKVETDGPDDGEEPEDLLEVNMLHCFIKNSKSIFLLPTKKFLLELRQCVGKFFWPFGFPGLLIFRSFGLSGLSKSGTGPVQNPYFEVRNFSETVLRN